MSELTFADILFVFRRKRMVFITSAALVLALTILMTLSWSRYRAVATIEIERPSVTASITNLSGTDTVTPPPALADRRIIQIEQRVTATSSLATIIQSLDLYPNASEPTANEQNADRMRRKITLDFVNSTVSNPAAAHRESIEQLSAIAFNLSFEHSDPALAKAGLDALVNRFITEEAAQRLEQSQATSDFIDAELATLEATIHDQEEKIADFRAKYGESGPSALLMNQQATMSNNINLQNIESQIATNTANIGTLRGQLAATDPYLPIVDRGETLHSPAGQLKSLQAQLAAISGRYGPSHPDVIKLNDQIAALKKNGYSSRQGDIKRDADNPVYLQISAQLSAMIAQQKALQAQQANLLAMKEKYASELAKNPHIEQQMSQLTLDLDQSKERYHILKSKKLSAEMKQKLDSNINGEQLRVISPATIPSHTSPRRALILILGAIFAIIAGTVMVILAEIAKPTVRSAGHLASIVGVAPIVNIPHIQVKTRQA